MNEIIHESDRLETNGHPLGLLLRWHRQPCAITFDGFTLVPSKLDQTEPGYGFWIIRQSVGTLHPSTCFALQCDGDGNGCGWLWESGKMEAATLEEGRGYGCGEGNSSWDGDGTGGGCEGFQLIQLK